MPPSAALKSWTPEVPLDTPYRKARQEWDRRIGSTVVQAKNWRLAAFACLALVLFSLIGLVYLGAQPKAIPHVIEVDKLGAPRYVGPAGQAQDEYQPSDASLRYHLRRFIAATRSVSSDANVVKQNWLDAYTLVTPSAANQLNGHAKETDPFKRMQTERVSVDVIAMVPLSKETWQADWREITWDKNGNQITNAVWRGSFRIVLRPPTSDDELVRNPIGLFIDEFHFSRVQE